MTMLLLTIIYFILFFIFGSFVTVLLFKDQEFIQKNDFIFLLIFCTCLTVLLFTI